MKDNVVAAGCERLCTKRLTKVVKRGRQAVASFIGCALGPEQSDQSIARCGPSRSARKHGENRKSPALRRASEWLAVGPSERKSTKHLENKHVF